MVTREITVTVHDRHTATATDANGKQVISGSLNRIFRALIALSATL